MRALHGSGGDFIESYVIAAIIGIWVLIFILKGIYDKIAGKKRLRRRLESQFGTMPENHYDAGRYKYLDYYFRHKSHQGEVVDDMTWNDLDMESIFMTMNQTCSGIGEEWLYAVLREPVYDSGILQHRQHLIRQFEKDTKLRTDVQMILCGPGKMRNYSMYQFVDLLLQAKPHKPYPDLLLMGAMIAGIILSVFVSSSFLPVILAVLVINIITYYQYENRIYFESFGYITHISKCALSLVKMNLPLQEDLMLAFKKSASGIGKLGKRSWIFRQGSALGGTLLDVLMDYVKMMFHMDLILFDLTLSSLKKHDQDLMRIMDVIGFVDAGIAIASYRKMKAQYCLPQLDCEKQIHLDADALYHPLVDAPVVNDIHTRKSVLVTGSNASGKSTFLKTVAVNAIFAQTICTVLAKHWSSSFFRIYSSMALKDNLMGSESYFIVEIKSLKRIFDNSSGTVPMLCFIDEVLRGTNTVERIAASSQLLYRLSLANTLCFAATHDIELTAMLENDFDNYHFQEEVKAHTVTFDYKIKPGRAVSRNAIRLLSMIGFDDSIVQAAEDSGSRFEKEGQWTLK